MLPAFALAIAALVFTASTAPGERSRRAGPRPRASAPAARARPSRATTQARPGIAQFRPGVVLLAFQPGVSTARQHAIEQAAGGFGARIIGPRVRRARLRRKRALLAPIVLHVPASRVLAAVHRLRRYNAVAYAEPDYLMRASAVPNDTFFPVQWADSNTGQPIPALKPGGKPGPPANGTPGADDGALLAWGVTTGSSSIVIGETDTGVDYEHPDLAANIWSNPGGVGECPAGTHGYNVLDKSVLPEACEPMDEDTAFGGHGTHVAGIMGAIGNNAAGVAGVNWETAILPVKWLGSAEEEGTNEHLIEALQWLVSAKQAGVNLRVVNDSATFAGTSKSQALLEEIETLGENNILFVTAAGNTGKDNDEVPRYPCDYGLANEICVTATDHNDQLPSWASYGEHTVDLAAPGESVYSTLREGAYGYLSGGSMAAPQVAGAAALILSVDQSLSAEELKTDILGNVDKLPSLAGRVITGGRLDICRALPGCALPAVETTAASSITQSAATLNATVDPNGVAVSECRFEYGLSASYGSSVPCSSLPGSGTAPVAVSAQVEGLSASTTYHFRILANNRSGPAYGGDEPLATLAMQPVTAPPAATEVPVGAGVPAATLVSPGAVPSQQQKPVPDAELTSRALFAGSSGIVSVKVACPSGESDCKGTVTLQAWILAGVPAAGGRSTPHRATLLTLAVGSFTVAGGQTAAVRMRLSAKARNLLAHLRVLHARATIIARDPTGATHAVTKSVTLRLLKLTQARNPHGR